MVRSAKDVETELRNAIAAANDAVGRTIELGEALKAARGAETRAIGRVNALVTELAELAKKAEKTDEPKCGAV